MRILFISALLLVWQAPLTGSVVAQTTWAPATVVAQTSWAYRETITLLVDACNTTTGTMRAQWVTRDRAVIWGCWGYNPTGVQVAWSTGRTEFIDWFDLWYQNQGMGQQLGYQTLHQRVLFLRNMR